VTGQDLSWFFDQLVFDSGVIDYEVSALSNKPLHGDSNETDQEYEVEVTIKRNGTVRFPVELLVTLESGDTLRAEWDGQDRWTRKKFTTHSPATVAQIDPDNKIVLDIDFANNSRKAEPDNRATLRWASKWLFWMQNLLQILSSIC
jgi:hypothetical protein